MLGERVEKVEKLASENEALEAQLRELQKRLDAAERKRAELKAKQAQREEEPQPDNTAPTGPTTTESG